MTYPQPREGIAGTSYVQDDLLSLNDQSASRRALIMQLAYHVYTASLSGGMSPDSQTKFNRISKPVPGDLVVEITTIYWGAEHRAFGYLLDHRTEWAHTDQEWAESLVEDPEYTDRPTDDAWYVQYGPQPDDVCRWSNASFIAVPTDIRFFK